MFIELDVWKSNGTEFASRTINVRNIEEFYPEKNPSRGWILEGTESNAIRTEQTYEEVRSLFANGSLLVNE